MRGLLQSVQRTFKRLTDCGGSCEVTTSTQMLLVPSATLQQPSIRTRLVMSSGDSSQGAKKKPDGAPGHSSKCFNCGKIGHASSECKVRPSGSTACYFCGKEGHQSKDCPDAPAKVAFDPAGARCYGCGKIGHLSRDCPDPSRAQACYTCGEKGHNTRCQPRHASKRDFRVPGDRQIPPKRSPLLMAQSHFLPRPDRYCPKVQANAKAKKKKPKPVGICHLWASAGLANVVRTATLLTLRWTHAHHAG